MRRAATASIAAAAVAGGAAVALSSASFRDGDVVLVSGAIRSLRAIYAIGFVVVDYKFSMQSLLPDSTEYRSRLSEVHARSAKRLLKLCESNGGFYVKSGQFVSSMRQVPKEYSSTLASLQDKAKPFNYTIIKRVLEHNLGQELTDIFLVFDERPIAAASIAQVHHGVLKNNQEVAVKVQYPGLEQRMKIDVMTMTALSKSISWFFPNYSFEHILSGFKRVMSQELDFILEGRNSERTASYCRKDVIIPKVYWDLTTNHVLTMEYCHGHKVDDLNSLRTAGVSPAKVAKTLMELFGEMIFVHGFVHGDPHPGNILVCPKGHGRFSLVLLDHGFYVELDETFRLDYCELWKALIMLDAHKILEIGEKFGVGKYAKYFPVIFTGRTLESKSVLGVQMSSEERNRLRQELDNLKMDDLSSFMESLPPEFLVILRTDGLLRSICGKLNSPRHLRLAAYAKSAMYGFEKQSKTKPGSASLPAQMITKVRVSVTCIQLRLLLELVSVVSQIGNFSCQVMRRLSSMLDRITWFLRANSSSPG